MASSGAGPMDTPSQTGETPSQGMSFIAQKARGDLGQGASGTGENVFSQNHL